MSDAARAGTHRHEALLYQGIDEFVERSAAFLRDGVEAGHAVLTALDPVKYGLLRDALGDHAADVAFLDMTSVGRNPGRLLSHWHDFVAAHSDRAVRGIGEPASLSRSADELTECAASEAVWNLAFTDRDVWVLCPYDTSALTAEAIDTALRTHPTLLIDGLAQPSAAYAQPWTTVLSAPLRELGPAHVEMRFGTLPAVRAAVADAAHAAGAEPDRAEEFLLAASETAANSLRHGGGSGALRIWQTPHGVVCEFRDAGRITDPLVGRVRPHDEQQNGRGLWMANQLCDLVQIRSDERGTTVRLHLRTR